MSDVAVVLDGSALLAYLAGQIAVGELIAEISDERRLVGVPAVCLSYARANADDEAAVAHLLLLTTSPTIAVLALGPDRAGEVDPVWRAGEFAQAAGGDLSVGHAIQAALEHGAYYATTDSKRVSAILPSGWGVLDLSL